MTILVSVVIPTYHRPQFLERCLQALLTQNFPPHAYEIIVVEDGQDGLETRQLISEWQQRLQESYAFMVPPVISQVPVTGPNQDVQTQVVYQVKAGPVAYPQIHYDSTPARGGPAAARNLGWRQAKGQIIAFTDDDCLPEPDWLANGVSAFVDGVAGVSGRTIVPLPENPTDNEINTTRLERSDFITANCFYRRAVLEEVGGFDERFAMAWREDSDLYFTIREKDYPLAWASEAVVVHPARPEKWGTSLRQQRKSYYNALLYKKHPSLYWRLIQPSPPWHYYAMLAGLALAAAGLASGVLPLAALGLILWAALLGAFIHRRLKETSHDARHIIEMTLTSLLIPFLSIYWRLRGAIRWRVFFL